MHYSDACNIWFQSSIYLNRCNICFENFIQKLTKHILLKFTHDSIKKNTPKLAFNKTEILYVVQYLVQQNKAEVCYLVYTFRASYVKAFTNSSTIFIGN